jgi:hypothetical protein
MTVILKDLFAFPEEQPNKKLSISMYLIYDTYWSRWLHSLRGHKPRETRVFSYATELRMEWNRLQGIYLQGKQRRKEKAGQQTVRGQPELFGEYR